MTPAAYSFVMAGLGPAIHDFSHRRKVVDTCPDSYLVVLGGHDAFAFVKGVIP